MSRSISTHFGVLWFKSLRRDRFCERSFEIPFAYLLPVGVPQKVSIWGRTVMCGDYWCLKFWSVLFVTSWTKISEFEYASVFRWMEKKRETILRLTARHSRYESFAQALILTMPHLFPFNLKSEVQPASILLTFRCVRLSHEKCPLGSSCPSVRLSACIIAAATG